MKRAFLIIIICFSCLPISLAYAAKKHYGLKYCSEPEFYCIKIKRDESWKSLFPDPEQRSVVKHLNRMNIRLKAGMTIAIPKDVASTDKMDYAPFPTKVTATGKKTIIVNQSVLAWGAYDEEGNLLNWAPISAGKRYCADVGRGCRTKRGKFEIYSKRGAGCRSSKYPLGRGGAKMPYCMFFYGGYAIHGSYQVPGYNASHGCVRTFIDQARWLHEEFIDHRGNRTIVIVL